MIASGMHSRHGNIDAYMKMRFGERFGLYREFWDRQGDPNTVAVDGDVPPANLLVDVLDACDMKCKTCFRNFKKNRGSGAMLTLEQFRNVMDQSRELGILSLSMPSGEPMLHPQIIDILECLAEQEFMEAILYTNGGKFDAPRRRAILACAGKMAIRMHVSLDAITADTFRNERGGDLDEVMGNIDAFLSEGDALGSQKPLLWVSFLIKESNRHEAEAFYDYWIDKADIVEMQTMLNPSANSVLDPDIVPKATFCSHPFRRLRVGSDCSIRPCCGTHQHYLTLGRVGEMTLREAWTGEAMRSLRAAALRGDFSIPCRNCLAVTEGAL